MANGYSWSEMRDGGTYRLPGPEHLGWWAGVAMVVSILLHVALFFLLDRMEVALRFEQAHELSTGSMNVRQVEVRPTNFQEAVAPEEIVQPPEDTSSLLEEIDLLDALPEDLEIDISPDVLKAEYALQMNKPAIEGDPDTIAMEISRGLEVETELPEFGSEPEQIQPAAVGQVTVDPGAVEVDDDTLGKFTEDLIKRGAEGKVEKGALDGVTSLNELLDLPPNILLGKKTMLPSDLLFEFNSAELRESAKIGLMKLALLMDRNPNLYCWIEGHTDLVGGDAFNLDLSTRRAEAVKIYLVESMRMDESKISTRGFGRYEPLVTAGTTDEQSINRRVEIRMRKTPPTKEQLEITPKKAPVVVEGPTPKAVLVKPKRALPLEAIPVEEPAPAPVPPAGGIQDLPDIPKAAPVEPVVPRASPVNPSGALRAEPVEG